MGGRVMGKATLQEYADSVVAMEYRQPLKTIEDACAILGWDYVDSPTCCGKAVRVLSFIGAYFAECTKCGKFLRDVRAPNFEGGSAFCLDPDKVDLNTDVAWIAGRRA